MTQNIIKIILKRDISQLVWHTPLFPGLGKVRQVGLWEFKDCPVYKVSSTTVRATQRKLVTKNKNKQKYIKIPKELKSNAKIYNFRNVESTRKDISKRHHTG